MNTKTQFGRAHFLRVFVDFFLHNFTKLLYTVRCTLIIKKKKKRFANIDLGPC